MTHTVDEHASSDIHLPKPSFWPMLLGLGFGLIALGFILWTVSSSSAALGQGVMIAGLVAFLVAVGGWVTSNIRTRTQEHAEVLGGPEAAKFAMWAFIGTECVIFGGLIAHALYLWIRDPGVNQQLHKPDSLLIVSVNTFLLLTSSLCVVLGLYQIQQGSRAGLAKWLGGTAALGAAFVGIQAFEYSKLYAEKITVTGSQFGSAFFFLTGFHGLHVLIGVIWALVLVVNALRGGFTKDEHMGVEVWGLYWHFVDVVWIFIFTLIYLL